MFNTCTNDAADSLSVPVQEFLPLRRELFFDRPYSSIHIDLRVSETIFGLDDSVFNRWTLTSFNTPNSGENKS